MDDIGEDERSGHREKDEQSGRRAVVGSRSWQRRRVPWEWQCAPLLLGKDPAVQGGQLLTACRYLECQVVLVCGQLLAACCCQEGKVVLVYERAARVPIYA